MPINFTNFAYLPVQSTQPLDIAKSFGGGVNAGAAPMDVYQRQKKAALMNAINAVNAKYAEPMAQSKLALLGQQRNMDAARELQARMIAQFYPQEAQARIANSLANANFANERSKYVGPQAQAGINKDLAAAQLYQAKAGATPGAITIDPNNPNVAHQGVSPKVVAAQQSANLAGGTGDYILDNWDVPYKGSTITKDLVDDRYLAAKNDGSPASRAAQGRLIKLGVAMKMLQENAAATLSRIGSRVTDQTQAHMLASLTQGNSNLSKFVADNLPKELYPEIGREFAGAQREVTAMRNKYIVDRAPFNPNNGAPIFDTTTAIVPQLPKPGKPLASNAANSKAAQMTLDNLFNAYQR